jgi:hypothetical protein
MLIGVGRLVTDGERSTLQADERADPRRAEALRTAFVIGPRHALTAWHCIRDLGGEHARVWLRLRSGEHDGAYWYVPLSYAEHDAGLDAAVLALDEDRAATAGGIEANTAQLASRLVPLSGSVTASAAVRVEGFPQTSPNPDGQAVAGLVTDMDAPRSGRRTLKLFVHELAAGAPEHAAGLSGGPVIQNQDGVDVVVGVASRYPGVKRSDAASHEPGVEDSGVVSRHLGVETSGIARGGALLASRIDDIAAVLPAVAEALPRRFAGPAGTQQPGDGDWPLHPPYRQPHTAESPLKLLRAEYGLVPFQRRDELTVLHDWCEQVAAGDLTGLAVVHGVGGAGKTRLALELADRLGADGWTAGVLPKSARDLGTLRATGSRLLVVVDYADGRVPHTTDLLQKLNGRPGPPAAVVLTARSLTGGWLADIAEGLKDDRHLVRREELGLPGRHPRALDVYLRTIAALRPPEQDSAQPTRYPMPDGSERWTTLDYVLLGWVAARGTGPLPPTRRDLYQEVLTHEEDYWCTVYRNLAATGTPERALLRKAAACLTLISPADRDAGTVLAAVPDLADDPAERRLIRRTLTACLGSDAGEGLAVRPDPVGDHLLLTELGADGDLRLFRAAIGTAPDEPALHRALQNLTRAGQLDPDTSTRLHTAVLDADPSRWPVTLAVAATQAGTARTALERLAGRPGTPLPLDDLSTAIPFESIVLYRLGLITDQQRLRAAGNARTDLPERATLLARVSHRASNAGDRDAALTSITEAVGHYRRLAEANPAAYLPNLATSLNNLSVQQADTGDRNAALTSITEAVAIRRRLAQANPAAYLPNLAMSLNNLSVQQADTGDRNAALTSITEAVEHYRRLAEANPAAYLPDLAMSLNNLSLRQADTGDRNAALTSITEAVAIRRRLAQANPAAYLPDLAASLNNLSLRQADTGDRNAALTSITEAVAIRRRLAQANPAAYLPDLAASLNNLSNQQADTGDRNAALTSITEAVAIRRRLAEANPAAYLPNLATSLNNLSVQQADTGDRNAALTSITEAVEHYRRLAEANPAAFLPNLAMSLNNLSVQLTAQNRLTDAAAVWRNAVDSTTDNFARAELRASWATWLRNKELDEQARAQLRQAAHEADSVTGEHPGTQLLAARSRQAVRSEVQSHDAETDETLPLWAVAPLPDTHLDLVNLISRAPDWPATENLLREHRHVLESTDFSTSLQALAGLFPGRTLPAELLGIIAEARRTSLGEALASRREAHHRYELIAAWIATPTWEESHAYYLQHGAELTSTATREALAAIDTDDAHQHTAILELALAISPATAFSIAADPSAAEEAALTSIENGDLTRLATITTASPALLTLPGTAHLITAVLLLASGQETEAYSRGRQLADKADPLQRRAHLIRLRRLQKHQPDLPGLAQLTALLDGTEPPPEDAQPPPEPTTGSHPT